MDTVRHGASRRRALPQCNAMYMATHPTWKWRWRRRTMQTFEVQCRVYFKDFWIPQQPPFPFRPFPFPFVFFSPPISPSLPFRSIPSLPLPLEVGCLKSMQLGSSGSDVSSQRALGHNSSGNWILVHFRHKI